MHKLPWADRQREKSCFFILLKIVNFLNEPTWFL
jgi:hypothetical protein